MAICPGFILTTPLLSTQKRERGRKTTSHHFTCCSAERPQVSRRAFLASLVLWPLALPAIGETSSTPITNSTSTSEVNVVNTTIETEKASASIRPRKPTWGYSETDGPSNWGSLSEEWSLASNGTQQSPISLSYRTAAPGIASERPRRRVPLSPARMNIRLKELPAAAHRSLQIEQYVAPPPPLVGDAPPVDSGPPPPPVICIDIGNVSYGLRRIHIHAGGGEHSIDSTPAVCEFHFEFVKRQRPSDKERDVSDAQPAQAAEIDDASEKEQRKPSSPQTLVVALQGIKAENSADWVADIVEAVDGIGTGEGKSKSVVKELDMLEVLPDFDNIPFYIYTGSLTTPPCTEGIRWIVLSEKVPVSADNMDRIVEIQGGPNLRPLQDINERSVIRYSSISTSNELK